MNKLPMGKQIQVLNGLVEGCSIRSMERMTNTHRDTVMRLGLRVGEGCARLMDRTMRGLRCQQLQLDELWGFVGKKQRNVTSKDYYRAVGDCWVFVAIDRYTKVVPCFRVGKRTKETATAFVADLAGRMDVRCQLSTDGLTHYVTACEKAFGSNVDYGQIVKTYEAEPIGPGRYSPPKVASVNRTIICGNPDPEMICTSHIENQNLQTRMGVRRLTRLTNAFSKRIDNHRAAVALHFAHHNFARIHGAIRVTPAMEAGVTDHVWSMEELICAADSN